MQTRDIDTGDGLIRTRVLGDGPPILFVHGALVDGHLWDGVVDRLADRFTCVVPDQALGAHVLPLPASADRSPSGHARRLARLLEALDLTEVTVVANDTGGALAQLLAADHGDRVGRLVFTNCDALEVFPPTAYAYLSWLARSPGALAGLAWAMNAVPALARLPLAYSSLAHTRIDDALLRSWLRPGRDPAVRADVAGFFRQVSPDVTLAVAGRLRHFDRPVLLTWGDRDPFFTLDLAERFAAVFPNATLRRVADARCYVPLDQPATLAELVAGFASEAREWPSPREVTGGR